MIFKSDLKSVGKVNVDGLKVSHLPQLYRCDLEFAKAQGNEELNRLLDAFKLTGRFKYVSIDTRSHMLMQGMYPCIPGWHCDDFYRTDDLGQQPDLEKVNEAAPAIHHMLIIGDCSRTEFTTEDIVFPSTKEVQAIQGKDAPVYLWYDRQLDSDHSKHTEFVEPGNIYTFGPTAFHRGTAATHNGWRYFIRITESNHRQPKNEIRYQTQVYTNGRVSW